MEPSAQLDPAEHAAKTLQELFERDPVGCQEFINTRTEVGEHNAASPFCMPFIKKKDKLTLGPLGMLNGVLSQLSDRQVCVTVDEAGQIVGFSTMQRKKPVS